MKRASSAGDSDQKPKKPSVSSEAQAFPRGAAPRAPKEASPAVRRPDGDTLFKSGDTKTKSPGGVDAVKKDAKFRGKAIKATTATRTKRKRDVDAQKRQGEKQEDLDSNWAEGGMRIPKFVEPLRFRKVNEGMLLLGVIKEVRDAEALVSLPNNLTGWVEVGEVSDELSELIETALEEEDAEVPALEDYLRIGMPVRCVVLSTAIVSGKQSGHHKNITVSLKPSRVNAGLSYGSVHVGMALYGAIASVEEHGYTVSLGTEELSAFLPLTDVTDDSTAFPSGVRVGQLVECVVKKLQSGKKLAILTSDQTMLTGSVTKELEDSTIDSLQPGMLVNAAVQRVMESGLVLRFLTSYVGSVDLSHLPARAALPKVENDGSVPAPTSFFREKTKVQGRILYVDIGSKTVGLSMRQHIVSRSAPTYHTQQVKMGQRFDEALVVRVDPGVGMMVRLAGEEVGEDDDEDEQKAKSKTVLEGWVHISNVSDDKVDKLEKHYKAGRSKVSCRVTGFSWIDGLVTLTMKPSVLATDIMVYEDVKTGAEVRVKVVKLTEKGCLVAVSEGVRGLIPPGHYADTELKNPEKLLVPGKMLKVRVLKVHAPTRKLILTNSKMLVNSELPVLTSIEDAKPGMLCHAHIAKIQDNGVVVSFYGNVKGFVMLSELGIDRETEVPSQIFRMNQVVKARIISVDLDEKRMKVSLRTSAADIAAAAASTRSKKDATSSKKDASATGATLLIGDVVEVEVTGKDEDGVHVKACDTGAIGFIPSAHLADYEVLCTQLMEAMPVKKGKGAFKIQALVVEHERSRSRYFMSIKRSLVAAAKEEELPSDVKELRPQQFVQGFVKNLADFGCFVGFLNGVTALAPKASLADVFVTLPANHYSLGQSVRCCVVSVDAQAGRAIVTLKPSVCMCPDASLLHSLQESEELLVRARAAGAKADDGPPAPSICVGSVVKALAEEKKSYGMLFAMSDGWTGFCPTKLLGTDVKEGTKYKVAVLAIDRVRDLMTLTMDPVTVAALEVFKGKTPAMAKAVAKVQTADSVKAVVQAVGEERVALTLADFGGVVALASAVDFNLRGQHSAARFKVGQELQAVVVDKVDGTVLVACGWDLGQQSRGKGRGKEEREDTKGMGKELKEIFAKFGGGIESEAEATPGTTLKVVVTGLLPNFLAVRLGHSVAGHIAMTDVVNADTIPKLKASPLTEYKKGQVVEVRVIGVSTTSKKKGKDAERVVDLSVRPEDLALAKGVLPAARPTLATMLEGDVVPGIIEEVRKDCLWVHISSGLKGRVYMLDTSMELDIVKNLPSNFKVGQGVLARVLKTDKDHGRLDLSLRHTSAAKAAPTPSKKAKLSKAKAPSTDLEVGSIVPIKIIKSVAGMSYVVQLSGSLVGRVHICDVSDTGVEAPLALYKAGDLLNGYIESMETDNVYVSLRPSRTGETGGKKSNKDGLTLDDSSTMPEVRSLGDITSGQLLSGYVKSTNAAGCFVQLGRNVTARVVISELSDRFIKDVKGAYPPGKLVTGRILDIDNKKEQISMSLKRTVVLAKKRVLFADVAIDQIVRGTVKSVQSFGVFVRLRNSDLSGLCHISEVSEEFVKDLAKQYSVGDAVKAKVLRKDETKKTISLGMKDAYFEGLEDEEDSEDEETEDEGEGAAMRGEHGEEEDDMDDSDGGEGGDDDEEEEESDDEEDDDEEEDEEENDDMEVETAAKKKKMEVEEDEEDEGMEDEGMAAKLSASKGTAFEWDDFGYGKTVEQDDSEDEDEDDDDEEAAADEANSKSKEKRRKKKEKERKEQVVKDKEAKLLDANHTPETAEEFERLTMSSPSSSYIWIKYMAFHLELTEIDKAREVSERALKTINFREEQEKFNVWVARLNLENLYGTKETVMNKFEEACKLNDAKKMHLQLLSIFEKNSEPQITEHFFKTLTRKFRASCKVWLRYCQFKLAGQHPEAGQRVLDRALEAIPKRKHVKLISKFAMMEYKSGSAERGRTLMEGVVSSYPKRIDLWSVFIEMENKAGNIEGARRLCERAVTLRLRARQAKLFFKRWLQLEMASGTPETVDSVKELARKWVEDNATA